MKQQVRQHLWGKWLGDVSGRDPFSDSVVQFYNSNFLSWQRPTLVNNPNGPAYNLIVEHWTVWASVSNIATIPVEVRNIDTWASQSSLCVFIYRDLFVPWDHDLKGCSIWCATRLRSVDIYLPLNSWDKNDQSRQNAIIKQQQMPCAISTILLEYDLELHQQSIECHFRFQNGISVTWRNKELLEFNGSPNGERCQLGCQIVLYLHS